MRKLLTIATLAVTVFAVAVPAASGAPYDPNPDFPHDDFDPGNWNHPLILNGDLTEVVSPTFNSAGNEWNFYHDTLSGWLSDNPGWDCADEGGIGGEFLDSYDVYVNTVNTKPNCWAAVDLPWYGQVCEHGPSGELWVRLNVSVTKSSVTRTGEVFLRLDLGAKTMSSDWGLFNHQRPAPPGWLQDSRLAAAFELDGVPDDTAILNLGGCAWPELQA